MKCALCQWRLLSVKYSLFFLHSREHSELCRLYANACAFNSSRGAIDGEINDCDVKWRLIDLIYPLLQGQHVEKCKVSDGEVNQVRHYTSLATGPTDPDGYPWKREYLITAQTDTSDSWSTGVNKRKELHLFASF